MTTSHAHSSWCNIASRRPLRTARAPFRCMHLKHRTTPLLSNTRLPHWSWGPPGRYYGRAGYRDDFGGGCSTSKVLATLPTDLHHSLRRLADGPRPPTPEGSLPAFAWGDVATPIRPIAERPCLLPPPLPAAPSARLAVRFPSTPLAYGAGKTTGLPRSADVPEWKGRISTPVAQHLRRRSSVSPDLATYLLVQAVQQLALVLGDDAYDALPGLAIPLDPGSQPPCCWQSQLRLAPWLPSRRRRLRCPGALYYDVPVGYCWQNSRCCHASSFDSSTATSATSCRTRTPKFTCGPLDLMCPCRL